ncbi:hypothetical protein GGS23DRAFT_477998 [Durotheca rogersii]|uniref:uncharacterized protein n=1 Tax=Durotheca rogersii TaxID=419775 RepID=UPI00221E7392|nr:uncharacterized protein GGS23DRAFT_477998 [Durotheca rogersii]KAI5864000.1 hypothetical protein GGS23DRAFT_477998 [Durotheca rogersii]
MPNLCVHLLASHSTWCRRAPLRAGAVMATWKCYAFARRNRYVQMVAVAEECGLQRSRQHVRARVNSGTVHGALSKDFLYLAAELVLRSPSRLSRLAAIGIPRGIIDLRKGNEAAVANTAPFGGRSVHCGRQRIASPRILRVRFRIWQCRPVPVELPTRHLPIRHKMRDRDTGRRMCLYKRMRQTRQYPDCNQSLPSGGSQTTPHPRDGVGRFENKVTTRPSRYYHPTWTGNSGTRLPCRLPEWQLYAAAYMRRGKVRAFILGE